MPSPHRIKLTFSVQSDRRIDTFSGSHLSSRTRRRSKGPGHIHPLNTGYFSTIRGTRLPSYWRLLDRWSACRSHQEIVSGLVPLLATWCWFSALDTQNTLHSRGRQPPRLACFTTMSGSQRHLDWQNSDRLRRVNLRITDD